MKKEKNQTNSAMTENEMKLNDCYEKSIKDIHERYYFQRSEKMNSYLEKQYEATINLYTQMYQQEPCSPDCGTLIPLLAYSDLSESLKLYFKNLINTLNLQ